MKKTFFGVFAAVMVFLLGSTTVFAAGPGCGRYFADADGDGICDNAGSICVYEDADGETASGADAAGCKRNYLCGASKRPFRPSSGIPIPSAGFV